MDNWFKKYFPDFYCEKASVQTKEGPPTREKPDLGRIYMIDREKIFPNRSQPRKSFDDEAIFSLADSIRRYGILQPLTVRSLGDDGDEYELVAGERRLRAAGLLGLDRVPCIMINANDEQSAVLSIIENIQREDLNMFEVASALDALTRVRGMTQERAARVLSVSQAYIANKLRLLRFSENEKELVISSGLTERHARAALRLDDPKKREAALRHMAELRLNVADSEKYVDSLLEGPRRRAPRPKRKVIIKDLRIFYNTLDRAVDLIKRAGIEVEREQREEEDCTELVIRIRHDRGQRFT